MKSVCCSSDIKYDYYFLIFKFSLPPNVQQHETPSTDDLNDIGRYCFKLSLKPKINRCSRRERRDLGKERLVQIEFMEMHPYSLAQLPSA